MEKSIENTKFLFVILHKVFLNSGTVFVQNDEPPGHTMAPGQCQLKLAFCPQPTKLRYTK